MNLTVSELTDLAGIVDRSGLAAFFDSRLVSHTADGAPQRRGRPRALSVRTLLIGLILTAADDREMHLTRVRANLNALNRREIEVLGIPTAERKALGSFTDRQISYLWNRMVACVDPSPHFAATNLVDLPDDEQEAEMTRRSTELQSVLDALVGASADDFATGGSFAIDWTYLASWARRRRRGTPSPDPDASMVYVEGGLEPKHFLFGYQVHALVNIPTMNGSQTPEVCARIKLAPASANPAPIVSPWITDMNRTGRFVRELLADRGYSMKDADTWHTPLRRAGVRLSFDLHENQRGPHGTFAGAIVADDGLFCPAMPATLRRLEALDAFETADKRQAKFDEAARRQDWAFTQLGAEKPDGSRRCSCPAAAGKARCRLKAASMNLPMSKRPIYPDQTLVENPPKVCIQSTVTVPNEVAASTRQQYPWGTKDWYDAYKRRRRGVESFFSLIKDPGKQEMSRGRIKMMGIARTSIMVAFWTAAVNLRIVAAFTERMRRQRVTAITRPSRRNRAVPFTQPAFLDASATARAAP